MYGLTLDEVKKEIKNVLIYACFIYAITALILGILLTIQ
jgi:hypothetical protein